MRKNWKVLMILLLVVALLVVGCSKKEEPAKEEPAKEEPAKEEPAKEKPAKEEPAKEEPAKEEPAKEKVTLVVSAAASLTDVLNELKAVYEAANPHVTLQISYAGSGTLQTQIEEGAPVDVFISAAQKQMNALEEKKLLLEGTRKDLLINKVVLIVPENAKDPVDAFDKLKDVDDKIAIGDHTNVPVGQYSQEIFTHLGMWDELSSKERLVYGTDVRTVLTWIEQGELNYGIVYATDAFTTGKVKIVAEAPEGSHKPVIYPVSVIKSSKQVDPSKAFIEFLTTPDSVKAFEKYGFTVAK